jgi:tetratricopeptide (TPR) repeat protein
MTMQTELRQEKRFVCFLLPWLLAAAVLVLYLLTLNHWVSLNNIRSVARTADWLPGAQLFNPLYYLFTYPFHWLPMSWVPLAYNLFSLTCAFFILVLLARSVALLPQDRTENQRVRERGRYGLLSLGENWIPPVLAVMVCGLQLTFWENATGGSSDLLDLLLVAYVIRCLLEYRIDPRESWLMKACLVCGLGMANSWIMFCLLPAFLVALIWIKGLEFFNPRFLLKGFLFGAAGMVLYLVMPTIFVSSADTSGSFWQALKLNLQSDRDHLMYLFLRAPRIQVLVLLLGSFLPILVISIRWASNFGDPSRMGSALATFAFHLAHAALLVVCLLMVLGSEAVSPRYLAKNFPGIAAIESLTPVLYYLAALSVGYLSGYFLLVFSPPLERAMRRYTVLEQWLQRISRVLIWALVILVPAALLYLNLPQIRMTNGPALRHYASMMTQKLPERAVVLSDDSLKLLLAQAQVTSASGRSNHFFLDTQLLAMPGYHAIQQKLHPDDWISVVSAGATEKVSPLALITLLARFSERMPVYYLHPSFGYYFESFYAKPHGLVQELKLYPTNSLSISRPPLTETEIAETEKFWTENQAALDSLRPFVMDPAAAKKSQGTGPIQRLLKKLHIPYERNATAALLGVYYSQGRNAWGVELQRAGRLKEAERSFQSALALNSDNVAAKSNLEVNRDLQAGHAPALKTPRMLEDEFGKYSTWDAALRESGPYDDPTHCYGGGMTFSQSSLTRQATQQFERVHELAPDNVAAMLWLARLYISCKVPDRSLQVIASLRETRPETLESAGIQKIDLFGLEASALLAAKRTDDADKLMQDAMREQPNDANVLGIVIQLSSMFGRPTNALIAADHQLKMNPDDPNALVNKGVFSIQTSQFADAVPPLERVLAMQTNNAQVELLLAAAYLGSDKTNLAEQHYRALERNFPDQLGVITGLAEISWRKKDTNTAIHYYQMLLTNPPPNAELIKLINDRLESLKKP